MKITRHILAYALAILAVCAVLTKLEGRKAQSAAPQPSAARAVGAGATG